MGTDCYDRVWQAWSGPVWSFEAGQGGLGQIRYEPAWYFMEWHGQAVMARFGTVGYGAAGLEGLGRDRLGWAGMARFGGAWFDEDRRGWLRRVWCGTVRAGTI